MPCRTVQYTIMHLCCQMRLKTEQALEVQCDPCDWHMMDPAPIWRSVLRAVFPSTRRNCHDNIRPRENAAIARACTQFRSVWLPLRKLWPRGRARLSCGMVSVVSAAQLAGRGMQIAFNPRANRSWSGWRPASPGCAPRGPGASLSRLSIPARACPGHTPVGGAADCQSWNSWVLVISIPMHALAGP